MDHTRVNIADGLGEFYGAQEQINSLETSGTTTPSAEYQSDGGLEHPVWMENLLRYEREFRQQNHFNHQWGSVLHGQGNNPYNPADQMACSKSNFHI